ncbi:peptidoglycan-binding protein [Larkinella bovis]|uniref:Peptidoglycan-binding protein n=1 Tax=Larkinella bovis TaxID=683041 RepID=A0ABW0IJE9_9BACT
MEPILAAPLPFPGVVIKPGHKNKATVRAIQQRLNEFGCGPIEVDGDFGKQTTLAVKTFQARFTDSDGLPLVIDGKIGSITWAVLFGTQSVPVTNDTPSPLLQAVLAFAVTQIGVLESPRGSNRGPEVDQYLRSVGLNPAGGNFAWCVAFLYFCFQQASAKLNRPNPMIKTAGVMDHWNRAATKPVPRITTTRAINNPSLVKPGHIFTISLGDGLGHCGIVEQVIGGKLVTIEGNTNEGGSREGIGVFRRSLRKIVDINKGFIDYSTL